MGALAPAMLKPWGRVRVNVWQEQSDQCTLSLWVHVGGQRRGEKRENLVEVRAESSARWAMSGRFDAALQNSSSTRYSQTTQTTVGWSSQTERYVNDNQHAAVTDTELTSRHVTCHFLPTIQLTVNQHSTIHLADTDEERTSKNNCSHDRQKKAK